MTRRSTLFFVLIVFLMIPPSWAAVMNADPKNSSILFNISHGQGYTIGYFDKFTAILEMDQDKIISAKAEIDIFSINTQSILRDEGLRSSIFFDAVKFPKANFESTKVEGAQMTGNLTIKGITKPVLLQVELKNGVMTARGNFDRNDFGINYNRKLKHNEKAIGDKVELIIEIKAG
jgi:polyisoprenoid-binding protein YceI